MQRKSILLVDDEQLILETLSRELEGNNFRITQANSGEAAIARIEHEPFDLVMTDLSMSEIDGFQVLQAAKRKDGQTIVIILTGYGDMKSAINALRLGADDFLQKPYDIEELLYRMFNCFSKQDLQRKIAIYENFLPVCSYCRKVRDDLKGEGQWYSLEEYFSKVKGMTVSHGCCPECYTRLMQGLLTRNGKIRTPSDS